MDALCWQLNHGSESLLVLLVLLVAFDTIGHGVILAHLSGNGPGDTVLLLVLIQRLTRGWGFSTISLPDDTQLSLSFPSDSKEAVPCLDQWLLSVMSPWMGANKLKLNPDKTGVPGQ